MDPRFRGNDNGGGGPKKFSPLPRRHEHSGNFDGPSVPLAHRTSGDGFAGVADGAVEPHYDADRGYRRDSARLARAERAGGRGAGA